MLIICASNYYAQTVDTINAGFLEPKAESILGLKPDEDVKTKVTISNLVETNINEAPNIISVITDEDINKMGYTDLLDVLNTVPGISIATDIQNGTAIGIRGNWAEEGKVLFMLDGLVLNDLSYGSFILGHRIPLSNISRIEIIRGAGSAIYGGLAALGVINIITKKGQQLNGSYLTIGAAASEKAISKGMINYTYGGYLLKGIELSVTGQVNAGNRSNKQVVLPDTTLVNFKDSSAVNDVNIQFLLRYKTFKLKQYYEDYNFQACYESIASLARTYLGELSNDFRYKTFKITPYVNYKWQLPWSVQYGDPVIYDEQNLVVKNFSGGYNGDFIAFNWLKFNFGAQYYSNNMRYQRASKILYSGLYSQLMKGGNGYLEMQIQSKFINLYAGGRYEEYYTFTPKILPRFSISKAFKYWHYKLVYGQSYKLPTLENINLSVSNKIAPENVIDSQAELGVDTKLLSASVVGFNTYINNMIVFKYDLDTYRQVYVNSPGTINVQGIEFATKLNLERFSLMANYSNYKTIQNTITDVMIDTLNPSKGNLAFPSHKVVTALHYNINRTFGVGLNYVFQTKKYSYSRVNTVTNEYNLIQYPSTHIINVVAQAKGLFGNIIDINIGVNNILNTELNYLYPYSSGYFNTTGIGRELFVQLKFNF